MLRQHRKKERREAQDEITHVALSYGVASLLMVIRRRPVSMAVLYEGPETVGQ